MMVRIKISLKTDTKLNLYIHFYIYKYLYIHIYYNFKVCSINHRLRESFFCFLRMNRNDDGTRPTIRALVDQTQRKPGTCESQRDLEMEQQVEGRTHTQERAWSSAERNC